jgi:hypothetical protein
LRLTVKRYEERLLALEARSKSTSFQRRMEETRDSPEYQCAAEYIKGLPDEDRVEFRRLLQERLRLA